MIVVKFKLEAKIGRSWQSKDDRLCGDGCIGKEEKNYKRKWEREFESDGCGPAPLRRLLKASPRWARR